MGLWSNTNTSATTTLEHFLRFPSLRPPLSLASQASCSFGVGGRREGCTSLFRSPPRKGWAFLSTRTRCRTGQFGEPRTTPSMISTRHAAVSVACLSAFLATTTARAGFGPVLNEIMASNDVTLADEDGEFSDWIEIRNSGDTAGNLNGWFLTDDAANTTRWAFPSTPLAPGELLVVFASNKNRAIAGAELHTNFKLSGDGEYLALVPPDGITPSSAFDPAYPPQFTDVSYGASPSSATIGYFTEPTPCLENGEPGSGPVGVVEFTPGARSLQPLSPSRSPVRLRARRSSSPPMAATPVPTMAPSTPHPSPSLPPPKSVPECSFRMRMRVRFRNATL